VPLILLAIALLVSNSPWVGSTVTSILENATGCEVSIERATIELDGRVELRGLRLTIPGLAGPEAELLSAEKAEIDLNWAGALSWAGLSAVRPTSIRLTNPVIRLSQSLDDGSLNIAGLARGPQGGGGGGTGGAGGGAISIPTVNVQDGRIEFAEHSARQARFDLLNTIHVAGVFASNPDGSYKIRMQEIGRAPAPIVNDSVDLTRGMILDGRIDLRSAEATLRLLNVPLEAWPPESVPTAFRDVWRRLSMQGRIRETVFTYDRAGGVVLAIWPEDVAMDIPVPRDTGAEVAPGDLSLHAVNGRIGLSAAGLSAELEGLFDEQTRPVRVRINTVGTGLDAPMTCEISGEGLTLANNPGFLPHIPAKAREFFVFFSGPTGEVDASVTIARGPPLASADGSHIAAPIVVTEGRMAMRNGTAAFHQFPYPFHSLEGLATFDSHHLNILDLRGRGPTGAKMRASAQVSPMNDDPQVDVSVRVENVPVDEHLRAAMPGSRKRLLEVLFNEDRYAALLAAGLVRPAPAPAGAPAGAYDSDALPFAFGGLCDIDVTVHRPPGTKVKWRTGIVVHFVEAGIVPEPFPFPIIAKDIEILISDQEGTLTGGSFTGLRGGRVELAAHVQLKENGVSVLKPSVDIKAFQVPVDDLLVHAIPDDGADGDPAAVSAKSILQKLELGGRVDCTAAIREAGGGERGKEDITFDVAITLEDLSARPRADSASPDERTLGVSGASGRIRVTQDFVRVESLGGRLVNERPVERWASPTSDSAGTFVLGLEAEMIDRPDPPVVGPVAPSPIGMITADIAAADLDLAAPLASLLRVFSADAAATVAGLAEHRAPSGRADATLHVSRPAGAIVPAADVRVLRMDGVSINAMGSRLMMDNAGGTITFNKREHPDPRRRATVAFQGFTSDIGYAGLPAGNVALDGAISIDADAPTGTPLKETIADANLSVRIRESLFDSPFVHDLLAKGLDPETLAKWEALAVGGVFDAEVKMEGEPLAISGTLAPRSVSFTRSGVTTELPYVTGRITLVVPPRVDGIGTPTGGGVVEPPTGRGIRGRLENLAFEAPDWRAEANGDWSFAAGDGDADGVGGSGSVNTRLTIEGETVTPELLAMMPTAVAGALRAINLQINGGFSMRDAVLVAEIPGKGQGAGGQAQVRFDGTALFADAAADVGAPVTRADGKVHIAVASLPGEPVALTLDLNASTLKIAGLRITDARALLASADAASATDEARGGLVMPYFQADAHGGRVWASAVIGPAEGESEQSAASRAFSAEVVAAGMQFAPLLDELSGGQPVPIPEDDVPVASQSIDQSRGQTDAWFSISGRTGDAASRIGRGAIRVANGEVLRLPVLLPLVQLSNFVLPSSDGFNYLQAQFHLRGQTAHFEDIAVLSNSVSLLGDGTLTFPEMVLDMRFNSRSNRRVPFLSDVYEALRDEIVTTRVRGTAGSPLIGSEILATTRGIFDSIFDPGREQAGSIGSDDGARLERDRTGEMLRPESPLPPTTMPSGG